MPLNARILIVDDDKQVTDSVGEFLEEVSQRGRAEYHYKYHAEVAYSGEEALEMVEKFAPHLVVLDWILPGMSGQQVCCELRRSNYVLGIIMLTQKTAAESEVQMLVGTYRADDYVGKPYSCDVLEAHIQSVLDRYHPDAVRLPCLISKDGQVYLNPNSDVREACFGGPDGPRMDIRDVRFDLLHTLMLRAPECLPYDYLLRKVWKRGGTLGALHQAILVLRQEMHETAQNAHHILSCGGGYAFGQPVRGYRCQ